jgi:hypothetical protein
VIELIMYRKCRIFSAHGGDNEMCRLLGCIAIQFGESPTFGGTCYLYIQGRKLSQPNKLQT